MPPRVGGPIIRAVAASGHSRYPALTRAVQEATRQHSLVADPVERASAFGYLLSALHEEVLAVTAERDAALTEVLRSAERPSNRALARRLGISPQRVDRLASIVRRGGRERRD